jgi:prepilin-type N-terminal cleavage/methylation domain-containing protein
MNIMSNKKFRSLGFTLIELLVAVSIVAILGVIALGVFGGVQGGARDSRRREELHSLAKNIESTYNPATGYYKYTTVQSSKDYPDTGVVGAGLPIDPSGYPYCIKAESSTTAPSSPTFNASTTWTTSACPTTDNGGVAVTGWLTLSASVTGGTVANEISDDSVAKSWTLCARLERGSAPYCIKNLPHQ